MQPVVTETKSKVTKNFSRGLEDYFSNLFYVQNQAITLS